MTKKFIKTNRSFSFIRSYGFLFTLLVAIGGLFQPKLGLLVLFIMAGLILSSLFNGKYWCGNICPHGSYFDNLLLPISRNKEFPSFLKSKLTKILFFSFFLFNFSKKIIKVFNLWGSYDFLDKLGTVFSTTYLVVLLAGSFLGILFSPRAWCNICPMGTMEDLSYGLGKKLGLNRREKKLSISDLKDCKNCGLCEKVCPMQIPVNKSFNEVNQINDPRCIKCETCIHNCPINILSMENIR